MPNLEVFAPVLEAAEEALPGIERCMPEIFGTAEEGSTASWLLEKLGAMPQKAAMGKVIHAAVESGHEPTMLALKGVLQSPMEARGLLETADLHTLTGWIRTGEPEALSRAQQTLRAVSDMGREIAPDPTRGQILSKVRLGVPGNNTWTRPDWLKLPA
jgi:hypothetical protein